MRILHLTMHENTGAGRAVLRLHGGLLNEKLDSFVFVSKKSSELPTVIKPKGMINLYKKIQSILINKILKKVLGVKDIFSVNITPSLINNYFEDLNPDIIHLHWIGWEFLRIEALKKLNRPIIWTLHDMWPFTGGCHYGENCGRYKENCGGCPGLGSKRMKDLSYKILRRKKKAWRNLNFTIIAPSHWLAECARSSSLFRNLRIEVIPHGLDLKKFQPIDKNTARNILSLPYDKKLILFGAIKSTGDKRKGFHFLQAALQELANNRWNDKADLIIFGSPEPYNPPNLGLKTHYMGYLHDDISLALLYSAADVMIVPSMQEAFGQTALEAMACGTPVVAFHATGLVDIVEHMRTGYLAQPFDISDLSNGITWVLSDNVRWQILSQQAREKVENEFALEKVALRYAMVYKELLRGTS